MQGILVKINITGKNSPMLRLTKFFRMLGWCVDDEINVKIEDKSLILSKETNEGYEVRIQRYGGSMGVILTNPFYLADINKKDYVRVNIEDDKLIIKKNKGTVIKF